MKYDYHWLFGWTTVTDIPDYRNGFDINFNSTPVMVEVDTIPFKIYVSNATMSNSEGELLFYTNGCSIANRNHEIMMNGDNINPGEVHEFSCESTGYPVGAQSCLVIPVPNDAEKYYLFHKAGTFADFYYNDKLYYSKIDMSLDNNLGGVVEKNVLLQQDTIRFGELTAIKHQNGTDWWLIDGKDETNLFYKYLITEDSIEGPLLQNIGQPVSDEGTAAGAVVFSPDGTKFARYNKIDQIYLYDFDRSTGLFSNFEQIIVGDTIGSGGCAISSNSRFLYVSTIGQLFQFDLEADDIEASKVLIDTYDGFADPLPTTFWQMQLAPDCRIFMNSTNTVDELHVIHNPNEKGTACNFEQRGFQLPSNHQFSMPHFPYYRMDTDYPICDSSLVVSSTQVYAKPKEAIKVYPNPTAGALQIKLPQAPIKSAAEVFVRNQLGQLVYQSELERIEATTTLDISDLPAGMYFLSIIADGEMILTEKVQLIR